MAFFHLEAKVITRSVGRSAVAASAYASCSRMYMIMMVCSMIIQGNEAVVIQKCSCHQWQIQNGRIEKVYGMQWKRLRKRKTVVWQEK